MIKSLFLNIRIHFLSQMLFAILQEYLNFLIFCFGETFSTCWTMYVFWFSVPPAAFIFPPAGDAFVPLRIWFHFCCHSYCWLFAIAQSGTIVRPPPQPLTSWHQSKMHSQMISRHSSRGYEQFSTALEAFYAIFRYKKRGFPCSPGK